MFASREKKRDSPFCSGAIIFPERKRKMLTPAECAPSGNYRAHIECGARICRLLHILTPSRFPSARCGAGEISYPPRPDEPLGRRSPWDLFRRFRDSVCQYRPDKTCSPAFGTLSPRFASTSKAAGRRGQIGPTSSRHGECAHTRSVGRRARGEGRKKRAADRHHAELGQRILC